MIIASHSRIGSGWLLVALCIFFTGCLPSSCRRIESRDVSPADSLSRRIAAHITPDTLAPPTIITTPDLRRPRTVLFGDEDQIYVGDTEHNKIFIFPPEGTSHTSFTLPNTSFPYLAGWRNDSLVVFDPESRQFHFVMDTTAVASLTVNQAPANSLQYALAAGSGLYLKAVTRDTTHFLWKLDRTGVPVQETVLYGSSWKHAGLLRASGNQLVSLSGFYPWALFWTENLIEEPDTLRWWGFDSPMLRRTYAFEQGQGREAPLITSAAVAAGEFWFVLNQRTGWVRIDIYDRAGMIQYIFVEANPGYLKNFYPIDIAAQLSPDSSYHLAVALVAPTPSIRVYQWVPPKQK